MLERTKADNNLLEQRFEKLRKDYDSQLIQSDQLAGENKQRTQELRKKEESVQQLKQEVMRGNKVRDGIQRKLRSVEEQKADIESSRESLKQQINSLERGIKNYCVYFHVSIEFYLHVFTQNWRCRRG